MAVLAAFLGSMNAGTASNGDPVPRLEHFGARDGLHAETVNCLRFDSTGVLWIGTREGLFSYDGYAFTTYAHDVGDPSSLVDNWVRTIHEDRASVLWVGTNSGGLARLDRSTGRFETFRHDAAKTATLSHDSVYAVVDGPDGKLWVGTQAGLNLFDPATGRVERRRVLAPSNPRSGAEYVTSIAPDGDGNLWIATVGDGVHRYGATSRTATALPVAAGNPAALPSADVFSLGVATNGDLWIATRVGIAVRRKDGSIVREARNAAGRLTLGSTTVTVIARAPAGSLWVGAFEGAFRSAGPPYALEPASDVPSEKAAISRRPVTALAIDRSGSLWIGTTGSGLFRLRQPPVPIRAITAGAAGGPGISYPEVTAVREDRSGRLWVGTFGTGLDRLDRGAERFKRVVLPIARGLYEGVLRIAEDGEGRLWVASTRGLCRYDPGTGKAQAWVHDGNDPTSLGRGYVFALLVDRDGRVWVGTGGGGLARLRPDGRSFERFPVRPGDPATPSDDFVVVLHQDREGRIWEGTRSGGLNLIDAATGRARRIPVDPANPEALAHHSVTSILEDSRGRLWFGTGGAGLARLVDFDPVRGPRFLRVTTRDGLVDDNVMALVEDDDGSLWVSTRQGLTRFDPDRSAFVSYGVADGLPSSEGNVSAAARATGTLYIGTMGGLIAIPRGTPFPASTPEPLVLTSVRTLRGGVTRAWSPWPPREVEVDYGEVLTVEFSVVDFDPHRRHRYAYRLVGGDPRWTDLGPRRLLTFTDLSPGEHVIEIRGRGARGEWSDPPLRLAVRVVPPFWRTQWFQTLVGLSIVATAFAWHSVRTARLERRNRELTVLKEQREAALREAHDKERELQSAFDRLRRLTRRLEAAKEEERKRIARELHDEMGQLLTAAKMNVQLLERRGFDERAPVRLADTVEILDRMIRLVRQISFDLRPPLLDEMGLVAALRGHLEALAERSGLQVALTEATLPSRLPPEVEVAAFRIVQEAVTNTVRHAGATRVDVVLRGAGDRLEIEVRDDGRGFDSSEVHGRSGADAHLGLPGMRERVHALGGDFSIVPVAGRGTVLRATLSLSGRG